MHSIHLCCAVLCCVVVCAGADAAEQVLAQSECSGVVCSADKVSGLLSIAHKLPALRVIIVMPPAPWEKPNPKAAAAASAPASQLSIFEFAAIEAKGRAAPVPHNPPKPDDLFTLCYTSGTTACVKHTLHTSRHITSHRSTSHFLLSSAQPVNAMCVGHSQRRNAHARYSLGLCCSHL